jgi:hypothetical protein
VVPYSGAEGNWCCPGRGPLEPMDLFVEGICSSSGCRPKAGTRRGPSKGCGASAIAEPETETPGRPAPESTNAEDFTEAEWPSPFNPVEWSLAKGPSVPIEVVLDGGKRKIPAAPPTDPRICVA